MHHVGVGLPQRLTGKPALVQRHVPQLHLIALVDAADLAVPRILHGIALLPAQQLDQQRVQRLRPGPHDDLPGRHRHPPELVQIIRDGLPQLQRTGGGCRPQQMGVLLQNGLSQQLRPRGKGKVFGGGGVGDEIHKPLALRRLVDGLRHGGRRGGQRLVDPHHVIPPLLHTADVPLGNQLFIGVFHRDNADLQMGRQRPLAGQLLPRRQHAGQNVALNVAVKLLVQAYAAAFFKGIGQHVAPPSGMYILSHFGYFNNTKEYYNTLQKEMQGGNGNV